jgi:hypothetical protein
MLEKSSPETSSCGYTYWIAIIDGKRMYHREDGPAFEYKDGGKEWYYKNKRHRLDGPAVMQYSIEKYYIYGEFYGDFLYQYWQDASIEIARLKGFKFYKYSTFEINCLSDWLTENGYQTHADRLDGIGIWK